MRDMQSATRVEAVMRRASLWLPAATAVVLALTAGSALAAPISDGLFVADSVSGYMSGALVEGQEPGNQNRTITINVRQRPLFVGPAEPSGPNGSREFSDVVTISDFTDMLQSDADSPGPLPDLGEAAVFKLGITELSDSPSLPAGVSDRLSVVNSLGATFSKDILESAESACDYTPANPCASVSITLDARTILLTESDGTTSDIVTLGAVTITLASDGEGTGADLPDSFAGTITDTALSDVPEPSSLAMIATGLLGFAFARRRSKKS